MKVGSSARFSPLLLTMTLSLLAGNGQANLVLSYDFDATDSIIYSTGVAVFQIGSDGKNKKQLFRDKLVETIVTIV